MTAHVSVGTVAGAFVAGLDAGHAYNTFPTMNGRWVPEEYWAVPGWRNAFESTAAVQMHHRALAASTLAAVAGLWAGHARAPLPPAARACLHYLLAATCAQVRGPFCHFCVQHSYACKTGLDDRGAGCCSSSH